MSENNMTVDIEKGQDKGQITYANEVIATIVTVATTEVEGISGIAGAGSSTISGILAKGSKTPRSVRVDMVGEDVNVDVSVTVDYGMPIQKVGRNAQENVRKSIESMTGLHVEKVDLHVVGVSFEKENQEMQLSQKAALDSIDEDEEHVSTPVEDEPVQPAEEAEEEAPQDELDGDEEETQE